MSCSFIHILHHHHHHYNSSTLGATPINHTYSIAIWVPSPSDAPFQYHADYVPVRGAQVETFKKLPTMNTLWTYIKIVKERTIQKNRTGIYIYSKSVIVVSLSCQLLGFCDLNYQKAFFLIISQGSLAPPVALPKSGSSP